MEFVWVALLMLLEAGLFLGVGLIVYLTGFRVPQTITTAVLSTLSLGLLALKAWILFGVFFWQFLVGAVAIGIGSLVIGPLLQILSNSMSADKNLRANGLAGLTNQSKQGPVHGAAMIVMGLTIAAIVWLSFREVRGDAGQDPSAITAGMLIYFTLGSFVGVVYSAWQTFAISGDRTVDPAVRNILAISSLGGWAGQAWRAAFPLLFLPAPHAALGFQFDLQVVLMLLGALYIIAVVGPLIFGARLYQEEIRRIELAASALIERTIVLNAIDIEKPLLEAKRQALATDLSRLIIDLNAKDPVVRRYTFWRWAPDPAFQHDGGGWTLKPNWRDLQPEMDKRNAESDLPQLLHVIERPWFEWLLGEQKRFQRNAMQEQMLQIFLAHIPNWSYRARLVDELVVILEKVSQQDLRNAAGLAQFARAGLTTVFAPEPGRTALAAGAMSLLTLINSAGLSLFGDDIRKIITDRISEPQIFGEPAAQQPADPEN